MRINSQPRASGKTTDCIRWAVKNQGTIVVPNFQMREHVLQMAYRQYPHVDPSWWDAHVTSIASFARRPDRSGPYVIDELDIALAMVLGNTPEFVTRTPV